MTDISCKKRKGRQSSSELSEMHEQRHCAIEIGPVCLRGQPMAAHVPNAARMTTKTANAAVSIVDAVQFFAIGDSSASHLSQSSNHKFPVNQVEEC